MAAAQQWLAKALEIDPRQPEARELKGDFLHAQGDATRALDEYKAAAATQTGVELRLVDGRTVLLRFANTATGGQITVRNAQGAVIMDQTLPTTVQTLPLMAM